jgi:hypothetical protein
MTLHNEDRLRQLREIKDKAKLGGEYCIQSS